MSHLDLRLIVKEEFIQISFTVGEERKLFVVYIFLCLMFPVFRHGILEWTSSVIIISSTSCTKELIHMGFTVHS